ncbi:MAG: hypothetical protein FWF83_07885, partial [Clostridiales bacterium]|nr:hypothetical protein [Clostridiales bacterium]
MEIFDGPYGPVVYIEQENGSWTQGAYSGGLPSGPSIQNPAVYYPGDDGGYDVSPFGGSHDYAPGI